MERSERLKPMRQFMHSRSVPTALLNYGAMGRIMKQLGVIKAVPNDYSRFPASESKEVDLTSNILQKKRQVGEYLYTANPGGVNRMPSSVVVDEKNFRDGWPLISIVTDANNLYGPEGIITNATRRGRQWERLAYVSYYENGQLLFSSGAGVRIHGGESRKSKIKPQSFRLYFRKDYGADQFGPGILFEPESEPLKRLVLRIDWPLDWPFICPFAFDVIRQIGGIAPDAKPVLFLLNGEPMGIYWFCEHLSKRQWRSRFGHDDFLFYRYKSVNDEETLKTYGEIVRWGRDRREKMTLEEAAKHIDVDSLSRYIFSIMFCGDTDGFQGVAVLDKNRSDSKWFWINWDPDHSFQDRYRYKSKNKKRKIWEQDAIEIVINKGLIRSVLFTRLLKESLQYRRNFVRLVADELNHRIDAEFLNSRINYYEQLAISYGMEDLSFANKYRLFAQHRGAFIREQMARYCGAGESLSCEVKGADGIEYEIDGYPERAGYQGWYFKGQPIRVKIVGRHARVFSHWLVNGKKVAVSELVYPVSSATVIEAVLKQSF
jgi:hypothetical protein